MTKVLMCKHNVPEVKIRVTWHIYVSMSTQVTIPKQK